MQNQVNPLSVTVRMSRLPADFRRKCGYDEKTGNYDPGACACAGCAYDVTLDEFKQWIKDGRPIVKFTVRFKYRRPEGKRKAVQFVMENRSCNAADALKFIAAGIWSDDMSYDNYLTLRSVMSDLFIFDLVCPNDTNKDGDCQFCHKDNSCPMKNS